MNALTPVQFSVPTKILYGPGVVDRLADECRSLGITKPLVVADEGVEQAAGLLEMAEGPLREAALPYAVFAGVPVEPDLSALEAGIQQARAERCDGVVGFGGGSPLVAARAIAVLLTNEPPLRRYEGVEQLQRPPAPVVAIPTTAGSGAEVSPSIPIMDSEVGRRIVVRGRAIYPRTALLDPKTLASLPPAQFVASGIDAFTHAVEAYVSRRAHAVTDALAFDAAVRMMRVLPAAAFSEDLSPKGEQLLASTMAMLASGTVGLGLVHGVNNAIYALARKGSPNRPLLPHGVLSGILLPHVMQFNLPVVAGKYAALAQGWRVAGGGGDEAYRADAAIARVQRLVAELGLPQAVPWEDITDEELEFMVDLTRQTVQAKENPRVAARGAIADLIRTCFGLET